MPSFRIGAAATLLGVSADTLRRWADEGRLATERTPGGQRTVDGAELARFAVEQADAPEPEVVGRGRRGTACLASSPRSPATKWPPRSRSRPDPIGWSR